MTEAQSFPVLTASISILGAVFLCWLARDCWNGSTSETHTEAHAQAPGSVRKALLTNLLNPHPYLFWLMIGVLILAQAWSVGANHAIVFRGRIFCLVGSKL